MSKAAKKIFESSVPYNFYGFNDQIFKVHISQFGNYLPRQKLIFHLGDDVLRKISIEYKLFLAQFSKIYSEVLEAMSEQDTEFLSQIMEPNLYKKTLLGFEELNKKNFKLKYYQHPDSQPGEEIIPKNSEIDYQNDSIIDQQKKKISQEIYYHEFDTKILIKCMGVFGPNIIREENQKSNFFKLRSIFTDRIYYLDPWNLTSLYHKQILVLQIAFASTRKLYVVDQNNEIVMGEDSDKIQYHLWRFETYTPQLDWILTDMDSTLNTNPYR